MSGSPDVSMPSTRGTGSKISFRLSGSMWSTRLVRVIVPNGTSVRRSGHATLLRASDAVRSEVDVFHPQPSGLAALNERVRCSFDPKGILNRGRMNRDKPA